MSGTAGQLIRTYLAPHNIHLSHFRQPRSEADGLTARLPKGKYRIGEFLFAVLESDPDLLWYIGGIHSRRSVQVSRLSWSVSYWRNVKPQDDAHLARQRLRTGEIALGKAVDFVDPGLEKAILAALGKPVGPIFEAELAAIDDLDASAKNIKNLAGLGRLPNLIWLNLSTNRISNLAPLGACKKLLKLGLSSNEITDISPLAGLSRLSILHLTRNQVSDIKPLAEMMSLERLGLNHNRITDVQPLLRNAESGGLGKGDVVWLRFNPLASESAKRTLPRLRQHGVTVHYELGPGIDPHTGIGSRDAVRRFMAERATEEKVKKRQTQKLDADSSDEDHVEDVGARTDHGVLADAPSVQADRPNAKAADRKGVKSLLVFGAGGAVAALGLLAMIAIGLRRRSSTSRSR